MRWFSSIIVGVLAVSIVSSAAAPAAQKKGKKTGERHISGTVVAVNNGSITIKTHHHGKKGAGKNKGGATRTFTIDQRTQIVSGSKSKKQAAAGGRQALHQGSRVMILAHNGHADRVTVQHHHKSKKKGRAVI